MRLLPAHTADAKEMARALCDSLTAIGLCLDCRDTQSQPPSLQQTQELLAKAMGYQSWRELTGLLSAPHCPVYLDGLEEHQSSQTFTALTERLAELLGFDYAHGHVYRALRNSGCGYSPKFRRAMQSNASPWGPIEEAEELAPGVLRITTAGHGGLLLSPDRNQRMPEHLRYPNAGYEEDGEFHLVALGFPEEASAMGFSLREALVYLGIVDHSQEYMAHSKAVSKILNSGANFNTMVFPELVEPTLAEIEHKAIQFLVRCVQCNRPPMRFPEVEGICYKGMEKYARYTLAQWVQHLSVLPTLDGSWPMRNDPWYQHWGWVAREDEIDEARERTEATLLARMDSQPGR